MATMAEVQQTYEFKGKIGEGGGGIVYLALHKRLKKYVVFKEIKHPSSHLEINRREADILKNIRHEALPGVLDFINIDGRYYTVMDYISGMSLDKYVKSGKKFTRHQLIEWAVTICRALECLHNQNPPVIHCDIKPANLLADANGKIHLIDFNISYYLNQPGAVGYSKGFSAPELAYAFSQSGRFNRDSNVVTEQTDIYALGATLYYLITGIKFDEKNPDWQRLFDRAGSSFGSIVQQCLALDRSQRYQSAAVLREELETVELKDQRLESLKKKHNLSNIGIALAFAAFAALFGWSFILVDQHKTRDYNEILAKQAELTKAGDYDKAVSLMQEGLRIKPNDLQTVYQAASALYKKADYKGAAELLANSVFQNSKYLKQDNVENAYYLLADSLFQQKNYEESLKVYQELMKLEKTDLIFYRDYAICLGYAGKIEQAEKVLKEAQEKGLSNDNSKYVQAELALAQGKTEESIAPFKELLSCEDLDVALHAHQQLADLYMESGRNEEAYALLKKPDLRIVINDHPVLLGFLLQSEINLANANNDNRYREEALQTAEAIENSG
ncbi:MAG: protein kinase, partial [Erysipelotrichaceae bacterium]|nr:protein kinase [Erysipelotrichaceae bacterium]